MQISSPAGYLRIALSVAAAACAAAAALTATVDPFGRLGRAPWGLYASSERDAKPHLARLGGHDALIIGSSKTAIIDPAMLPPPWRFLNASFASAVPEEIAEFLDGYVGQTRLVLIGLDFYMMNERGFPASRGAFAAREGQAVASYLLSGPAAVASLDTLWRAAVKGEPPGVAVPAGNRVKAADAPGARIDDQATLAMLRARHYHDVRYAEWRLAHLAETVQRLQARGVTVKVFINPLAPVILELLRSLPAWPDFLRFRADVARYFPGSKDLSWSDLSDRSGFYAADPFHYKPEIGRRLVAAILDEAAP
ncbi:hypothetical protein [Magnetospirillum moscoviense]|uniref:SGNH hydrolase-type esterase domain-containing protein n=1 Tax=Magnetospirillum moscoviense TaxID=1437059 RepID=A0A178MVY7_9PROT|nr:hypothetical protein [Magnetospirillum moscoviense]OAN54992.1 hypothetical protein A6A05_00075 [Magnetospirillum moscoviense]